MIAAARRQSATGALVSPACAAARAPGSDRVAFDDFIEFPRSRNRGSARRACNGCPVVRVLGWRDWQIAAACGCRADEEQCVVGARFGPCSPLCSLPHCWSESPRLIDGPDSLPDDRPIRRHAAGDPGAHESRSGGATPSESGACAHGAPLLRRFTDGRAKLRIALRSPTSDEYVLRGQPQRGRVEVPYRHQPHSVARPISTRADCS